MRRWRRPSWGQGVAGIRVIIMAAGAPARNAPALTVAQALQASYELPACRLSGRAGAERGFTRDGHVITRGYRASRPGTDLPDADAMHLLFTLSDLAYVEQQNQQGPIDEWGTTRLASCRAAIAAATDAAAPA